jgi:hypothetical protein
MDHYTRYYMNKSGGGSGPGSTDDYTRYYMNQSGGGSGPGSTEDYTRYYMNQSGGGGDIGDVYRASFRTQRGNGIGSFFRGLFRFVKPLLYSGAKAVGKEALKTCSNILTDMLDKEPNQPMKTIFKSRFGEAKDNLEQKIKTMTGLA